MMRTSNEQEEQDQQSRLIYELCALLFTILRTSSPSQSRAPNPRSRSSQITPAAFASLLLGASMALMLCGSVTFVLGFILMPWIVGFVLVLYFVGVVCNISARLERTVFWCGSGNCSSPKELQGEFFSKQYID
ncbi:hypothetical protein LUZ60_002065 [Juncus effusus]|nr:hypothetical protein LUZ60_002065 [Juncus effusus]